MSRPVLLASVAVLALINAAAESAPAAQAVVRFKVRPAGPALLDRPGTASPETDAARAVYLKTQAALLESPLVLAAALKDPKVAEINAVREAGEKATAWLAESTVVGFAEDSLLMELIVAGDDLAPSDAKTLANAIANAYLNDVVFADRRTRLRAYDILKSSNEKLAKEIARKSEQVESIGRDLQIPGAIQQRLLTAQIGRLEGEILRLEDQLLKRKVEQLTTEGVIQDRIEEQIKQLFSKRIDELQSRAEELTGLALVGDERITDLEQRRTEIEQLQAVQRQIQSRIQEWEVEADAPPRVERIPGVEVR